MPRLRARSFFSAVLVKAMGARRAKEQPLDEDVRLSLVEIQRLVGTLQTEMNTLEKLSETAVEYVAKIAGLLSTYEYQLAALEKQTQPKRYH